MEMIEFRPMPCRVQKDLLLIFYFSFILEKRIYSFCTCVKQWKFCAGYLYLFVRSITCENGNLNIHSAKSKVKTNGNIHN